MLAVIITLLFLPKCVALYAAAMASFAKCLKHTCKKASRTPNLVQLCVFNTFSQGIKIVEIPQWLIQTKQKLLHNQFMLP